MKVPIAYGLSFPERIESGAARLDFLSLNSLTFEAMDPARFPGLQLAWDCLSAPNGTTTVLNAANEVAVAAFLAGAIRFTAIHEVNARCIDGVGARLGAVSSIDDLLDIDERARVAAGHHVKELQA
jgi:1-deoxy-D-xylulose-5-phosphate reductoisomerase